MNKNKRIYPENFFNIEENEKDQLDIINRIPILKNGNAAYALDHRVSTQM